jgi:hypothetical protein
MTASWRDVVLKPSKPRTRTTETPVKAGRAAAEAPAKRTAGAKAKPKANPKRSPPSKPKPKARRT